MTADDMEVIDSHIHLYARDHISSLNWTGDLPNDHILNRQSSVQEYKDVVGNDVSIRGFVFVETDRKFGLDESGWQDVLQEVAFLARIARDKPAPNEGHMSGDGKLVLGIVPWAPVPSGPLSLKRYIALVRDACVDEHTFNLVKGFRYLVQDKPAGTMTDPNFVLGLQYLESCDFVFDLGVDTHSKGIHQLEEACEMLEQVYRDGVSRLKIVLNHFCKPNLTLTTEDAKADHPEYKAWRRCIHRLATYPNVFMKLSGFFSELPTQLEHEPASIAELAERVKPWVDVVFSAFGPSRIMFGSDWPVCAANGPGTKSWKLWHELVVAILDRQDLSEDDKREIWSGTAVRAYNIRI